MVQDNNPFDDEEESEVDISSLIDVAFLLLIYFLVTTTLQKKEGDLSLQLPGVEQSTTEEVKIDQMLVRIEPSGQIYVNEEPADMDAANRTLPVLTARLLRYARGAQIANTKAQIIIDCADDARGQRFVDVLNACAKAEIKYVSLAQ